MKKLLSVMLILLMMSGLTPALAEPEPITYTWGNYKYILLENGTAEITRYTGKDTSLTIPAMLYGYTVTSIGDYAFSFCDSLTTVSIPDSVTAIGDYAFSFCDSLTAISIPDSVTAIGENPFCCCEKLTDIIFSPDHPILATIDGVLFDKTEKKLICYLSAYQSNSYVIPQGIRIIGDDAFYLCDSLTSISIPDSVTAIGNSAFSGCFSLTTISIPDSVTAIGDDAFYLCDSLTSISIPDSVTSIGDHAFSGCDSLTTIFIPDSVTTIGANPFYACKKLTDIIVSPDHSTLATIDGVLFEKTEKELICYPMAYQSNSYVIPQGIRIIRDYAFSFCDSLTTVSIPDSVTSIADDAFSFCDSLTTVSIPDSVTSIADDAFSFCSSLITITVPRNSYAAQYCKENGLRYTYPDANDWLYN